VDLGKEIQPALGRRTEVKQLEAKQHAEETRVSLESRALWPNLAATGRYAQRNLSEGQWNAGVTLNWTIFDSFRVRNRMASALEQARVTRIQAEQTRQRVALEIRQHYQNRAEAQQRVATAREGLAAAQEAYRLALKRFQVGVGTGFEVVDVQNTLIQASNNYVLAVNDLRIGEVRLARALGYDVGSMLTAKRR
jgi:outer membrane protein TolC